MHSSLWNRNHAPCLPRPPAPASGEGTGRATRPARCWEKCQRAVLTSPSARRTSPDSMCSRSHSGDHNGERDAADASDHRARVRYPLAADRSCEVSAQACGNECSRGKVCKHEGETDLNLACSYSHLVKYMRFCNALNAIVLAIFPF